MTSVAIRAMAQADWPDVRRIFQEGIDTGHATFESRAPGWEQFDASRHPRHRLVATADEGGILGWAAVSPVSARPVYSGVVKHSIYVTAGVHGRGIGSALLRALAAFADDDGIWTIQASVFPENAASLTLHLNNGYAVVGRRQRIARMTHGPLAGQWRDTILIERRSPAV